MNNTPLEIEKTEAEYETEYELIHEMFPDANFTVSIPIEELDDVVSIEQTIVIKLSYNCHCYSERPKFSKWFNIRCNTDGKITNKTILNELIKQNLKLECDHQFIEGFDKKTVAQYEIANFS